MKHVFFSLACLGTLAAAAEPAAPSPAPPAVASPATATAPAKAEAYLMLPEPRELKVPHSKVLGDSRDTVFTPARITSSGAVQIYTRSEFAKLGIGVDSFYERAQLAADKRLATFTPELIKDSAGRVRYAVYRGETPAYAALMIAPSLVKVFEKVFGSEVWVAAPDRNALCIFPPNAAVVDDFAADLEERYQTAAYAASPEVFRLKADGKLEAVASFTDR